MPLFLFLKRATLEYWITTIGSCCIVLLAPTSISSYYRRNIERTRRGWMVVWSFQVFGQRGRSGEDRARRAFWKSLPRFCPISRIPRTKLGNRTIRTGGSRVIVAANRARPGIRVSKVTSRCWTTISIRFNALQLYKRCWSSEGRRTV